ncbi:hypothetical protein [Tindallia californiensis]|uniref:Uncharacterized protein n=1 Tax=Tindallia californiensis TaxID=159292 RepID=A0A1H3P7L1_9FIRM|nr:hypothetical protein [Tindallia californiensis]SDY97078.1 hypothetical protein SAMN05192546_10653 [Tindallia californiensis]
MMVGALVIPFIMFALLGLLVIGVKGGSHQGGEEMIKNVYIYVVLFATLMMTIGGSVAAFMALADIVAPTPYYQSYEDYRRWNVDRVYDLEGEEISSQVAEEIRGQYDAMVAEEQQRYTNRAKNNLIKSFGWIVIPLPIFLYYSRKLKQHKHSESQLT